MKETKYYILITLTVFFIPIWIIDSFLVALMIFISWMLVIVAVQGDAFFHKDSIGNQHYKVGIAMLNPFNRSKDIDRLKQKYNG